MKIPYYGRPLDESYFRGGGWRAWLILAANWLRDRLQRWVEYRTMLFIAHKRDFDQDVVKALKVRWTEEQQTAARRRKTSLAALALDGVEFKPRLQNPRKNSPPPDAAETNARLSRLLAGVTSGRYPKGRAGTHLYVQEVDAEVVPATERI